MTIDSGTFEINCPILTTERLVLRPPHKDDAEDVALLADNVEIARNMAVMPHPYLDGHAMEFVQSIADETRGGRHFAVSLAENGRLIGICGINKADSSRPEPNMGYWLGEDYWGNGYATEIARALVDMYFKVTDRELLIASILADNIAARRVVEKCGGSMWRREEVFSDKLGVNQTLEHFRISRADWVASIAA